MPRVGVPLFTTFYPDRFPVGSRVLRRKDNRYYIVSGIQKFIEDGEFVYTVYGYVDPHQGFDQEDIKD